MGLSKKIFSPADVDTFERTRAFKCYLHHMQQLSAAVQGKALHSPSYVSPHDSVRKVQGLLHEIKRWVMDIEPMQQPQRFGNKAFRTFHSKLVSDSEALIHKHLQFEIQTGHHDVSELCGYLHGGFGNETRIDYGTGHEASFFGFLIVLLEWQFLESAAYEDVVLVVFFEYFQLVRFILERYNLEPAGSHGVWGLDDYHFLPYVFGASQLIGNPEGIQPQDVMNELTVKQYAGSYLYVCCVDIIRQIKRGPFGEHSPMLHSISQVPSWEKTFQGMVKMYRAEVLLKFPVIQHFLFGNTLSFVPV
eukprot:ANDGO_08300.mRNA.1 putative serine/threonine-protein phosphatase 2A activator 1